MVLPETFVIFVIFVAFVVKLKNLSVVAPTVVIVPTRGANTWVRLYSS
jgi:hypothetical protein